MSIPYDSLPSIFILYGSTGDLARKKILPAFCYLEANGHLSKGWKCILIGRQDISANDILKSSLPYVTSSVKDLLKSDVSWDNFSN